MTAPTTKFRCIVIDPPWPQKDSGPRSKSTEGFWAEHHHGHKSVIPYARMSYEEMARLRGPINRLVADDAHCYLWTTSAFIVDALGLLGEWDFRYVVTLTWCKAPRGDGFGGAFKNTSEFVLLGKRGSLPHIGHVNTTWFQWKRPYRKQRTNSGRMVSVADHSRKPDGFFDVVQQVSPGPYLELFARHQRLGWETWGDEALEHVEMAS